MGSALFSNSFPLFIAAQAIRSRVKLWQGKNCAALGIGGVMRATRVGQTRAKREEALSVDFALQGGGSHGAFTWGVLDNVLQMPWVRIEAVSGTSAGAMNAAVMIGGYEEGGPEGARAAL